MVKKTIIYWRDIPAQVIVQRGRRRNKQLLSPRFQQAIDRAAMRAGKGSSNAYLSDWRRASTMLEASLDVRAVAEQIVKEIEAQFSDQQLSALIRQHGLAAG